MCDFFKPPRHLLIKRLLAGAAHIIKYGAGDGRPIIPEGIEILQGYLRYLLAKLHSEGITDQQGNFLNGKEDPY